MREVCPLIFKTILGFKPILFCAGITLISASIPCYGQLPPTNMGQFVHQPGDNQYTNQAQMERHGSPVMPAPSAATSNISAPSVAYTPTPSAPKPDVSLLPIVADEPIKPAGFPPLPDRLDLPTAGAGVWTSSNSPNAGGIAPGSAPAMVDNGIPRDAQGVHQHYVHYQAGAFMPNQSMPQNNYKPSSSDYYNINPNAKAGMAAAASADSPSVQALNKMGPEPQLAADKVSKPEAPEAVTVNQSVTQDLSLPEDDFNKHYPANINNNAINRNSNNAGRMLVYPLRSVGYMGFGMAAGAAMYAIRR